MAPLSWHTFPVIFDYSPVGAAVICFALASFYVLSLYVAADRTLPHDHPETIKQRFRRVFAVCLFSIPFLWLCCTNSNSIKARPLLVWVGLRLEGTLAAIFLPLLLTVLLFLGPLTLHYLDGVFPLYITKGYWISNLKNLIWVRNHVVGPVSEELVFRACMLPVLVPSIGPVFAIFLSPMFFGLAHGHHIYEKVRDGFSLKTAVLSVVFQFCFTSIFGAYAAFLFLRTGHLLAPIVAHAFCNHMGFPDVREVMYYSSPERYYIMAVFVAGVALFFYFLFPLTEPSLFANDFYTGV